MDTKRIIAKAFVDILHTVSFKNITTQMILEKSTVSRSTFYRHFKDKYDVMTWYYQDYVDDLINKHEYDCKRFLEEFTCFVRDNQDYFRKVIDTTGDNSFFSFVHDYTVEYYRKIYINKSKGNSVKWTDKDAFQIFFFVQGSSAALKQYVMNGCKEDPKDIAGWAAELFPPTLKRIIE